MIEPPWTYRATVLRWVDGDTADLDVDLGFYTRRQERVRLIASSGGIDAPEMNDPDPATRAAAQAALARAAQLAPAGSEVLIRTARPAKGDRKDGFGRFLACIIAGGVDVGEALLTEGHAVAYRRGA